MAYPAQSTARASEPGSLWWRESSIVRATQWDVLVRLFRLYAAGKISGRFTFAENGDCRSASQTANAIAFGQVYNPADLLATQGGVITGQWDDTVAHALGWLMCAAGAPVEQTQAVSGSIRAHEISPLMVRWLILFGLHAASVGSSLYPALHSDLSVASIVLPDGFVVPDWDAPVASDVRDRLWVSAWNPDRQTAPIAPSLVPASQSVPNPPSQDGAGSATMGRVPSWRDSSVGQYVAASAASVAVAGVIAFAVIQWSKR